MEFSHYFALLHVPFTFCKNNREEKLYINTWGGRRYNNPHGICNLEVVGAQPLIVY